MNTVAIPGGAVDAVGGTLGGIIGGVLGAPFGPVGAAIGRYAGSAAGRVAARAAAAAIANMMEDANEDAEEETKAEEAKATCVNCKIDCFEPPEGADREEFARQLKEQQDAINEMSPDDLLDNIADYAANGRPSSDGAARQRARREYRDERTRELEEQYLSEGMNDYKERAAAAVVKEMAGLAATHVPDLVAGGTGRISGLGDARINSSLGSQWGKGRAQQLKEAAEAAKEAGDEKMDVELEVCPEEGGGSGTPPGSNAPSGGTPGQGSGQGQSNTPMS